MSRPLSPPPLSRTPAGSARVAQDQTLHQTGQSQKRPDQTQIFHEHCFWKICQWISLGLKLFYNNNL
jgi:hypothetical protein